jgi:hypothetical protein
MLKFPYNIDLHLNEFLYCLGAENHDYHFCWRQKSEQFYFFFHMSWLSIPGKKEQVFLLQEGTFQHLGLSCHGLCSFRFTVCPNSEGTSFSFNCFYVIVSLSTRFPQK